MDVCGLSATCVLRLGEPIVQDRAVFRFNLGERDAGISVGFNADNATESGEKYSPIYYADLDL